MRAHEEIPTPIGPIPDTEDPPNYRNSTWLHHGGQFGQYGDDAKRQFSHTAYLGDLINWAKWELIQPHSFVHRAPRPKWKHQCAFKRKLGDGFNFQTRRHPITSIELPSPALHSKCVSVGTLAHIGARWKPYSGSANIALHVWSLVYWELNVPHRGPSILDV
ncbi:hypothetical protein K7432_011995 [Basidiobolus ranarum]|uniref:Uncharacterized protein n=1 Tax=Basidiobolus ranarum TaxID=34480 RepID=A0ABR2VT03_9FUNG